ncbi:GntR family transcriptional regulator [Natranaerobius thermophilus]|uniref:GntR family transcriptional regulator n=1 Tax=Natranaerobius thermophilus TaxID=375929 RepID=UPI0001666D58|nr:GntR family transcriptional regulator [Natranaerobius thermophilus]
MEFKLERKSRTPYYLQIKENIKKFVEFGYWTSGTKLPTERELAERLQVSRNTVSMAYKELESDGVIVCHQGRGTFIAEKDDKLKQQSRKEHLLKIIDVSIEEALQLGFTIDDFLAITHVRAREKQDMLTKLNIAFVECNQEQLHYFVNELNFDKGVSIIPILVSDLKNYPDTYRDKLSQVDIIITTFFHLEEIKESLHDIEAEILPIALELQMETVVKIARVPSNSRVGLICKSENFAHKFMNSLTKAGIDHVKIDFIMTESKEEIIEFTNNVDYVVTSPGKKHVVADIIDADPEQEITEVIFRPDQASLNLLKSTLVDLKQKVS